MHKNIWTSSQHPFWSLRTMITSKRNRENFYWHRKPANEAGSNFAAALPIVQAAAAAANEVEIVSTVGGILFNDASPANMSHSYKYIHTYMHAYRQTDRHIGHSVCMHGCMDGCMHACMDGWMHLCMYWLCMYVYTYWLCEKSRKMTITICFWGRLF